jgi:hypothetical protein
MKKAALMRTAFKIDFEYVKPVIWPLLSFSNPLV